MFTTKPISAFIAALTLCALVRLWVINHTVLIAKDGAIYVEMARRMPTDLAGVVKDYDLHPGYSAAIVGTHQIMQFLGQAKDLSSWDLSGQIVSLVSSLLAMAAVWAFARMAFDNRIAWLTVLLFGIGLKWVVLGADVCSDALAVCFQMWAAVLAIGTLRLLQRGSRWAMPAAAGTGLCAGLGYLVRPEALLVATLAVALWLGYQLWSRRGWLLSLSCVLLTAVATLACASPYMLAIGGLTKKKRLSDIIMLPAEQYGWGFPLAVLPAGLYDALSTFVNQFVDGINPLVAFLLSICVGVWLVRKVLRRQVPAEMLIFPRRDTTLFMAAAFTAILLMLTGLYRNVGYISHRHLMFLAALVSPLAGAGLVIAVEGIVILARRMGLHRASSRMVFPAVTLVVTAALLHHGLQPLHKGKEHYRQSASFVSRLAEPGDYIIADDQLVIHYIGIDNPQLITWNMPVTEMGGKDLLEHIRQHSAKYLIINDRTLADSATDLTVLLNSGAFTGLRRFPPISKALSIDTSGKKPEDVFRVYRINLENYPAPGDELDSSGKSP